MTKKEEVEISESGFLDIKEKEEKTEADVPEKSISDRILVISIVILICALIIFIALSYFSKEKPKTIDDLHSLNLKGDLKPEQGYVYNGYSFVFYDGLWYTQVQRGNNLFSLPLHYGPKQVEDVRLTSGLNSTLFNANKAIYYTFNPIDQGLTYVKLSVWEFVQSMTAAFNKVPLPACDKNETEACKDVPILTCENTDLPVVYFKQESPTSVSYKENCILVQGQGAELVKATDRMLLNLYGIMD